MYREKYGFLLLIIILGLMCFFCMGFMLGKSKVTHYIPSNTYKDKFPPICRIYISPEGMVNVSSPTGEVEVYSENQNTIIEGLDNEKE